MIEVVGERRVNVGEGKVVLKSDLIRAVAQPLVMTDNSAKQIVSHVEVKVGAPCTIRTCSLRAERGAAELDSAGRAYPNEVGMVRPARFDVRPPGS